MLVDTDILRSIFEVVSGPSVNPTTPDSFEPELLPDGLRIFIKGKADSAALCKIVRSLPSYVTVNPVKLKLFLTIVPDDSTALFLRCREFDVRITDAAGWTYPLDMQINWAEGGMFQVATGVAAGTIQWMDTGILVKMPAPGTPLALAIEMEYDLSAHTCSITSFQGTPVPITLQKQAAAQMGWTPSQVVFQHQLCLELDGETSDLLTQLELQYLGS